MSSLKTLVSGAAPLSSDLVDRVVQRLETRRNKKGNLVIVQGVLDSIRTLVSVTELVMIGYGLTETSPTTHFLPAPDAIRKVGSIGILLPNLEARLVVDGDGNTAVEANEGKPGELWIRGPIVMKVHLVLLSMYFIHFGC